jgi:hypothetical protein
MEPIYNVPFSSVELYTYPDSPTLSLPPKDLLLTASRRLASQGLPPTSRSLSYSIMAIILRKFIHVLLLNYAINLDGLFIPQAN